MSRRRTRTRRIMDQPAASEYGELNAAPGPDDPAVEAAPAGVVELEPELEVTPGPEPEPEPEPEVEPVPTGNPYDELIRKAEADAAAAARPKK